MYKTNLLSNLYQMYKTNNCIIPVEKLTILQKFLEIVLKFRDIVLVKSTTVINLRQNYN